MHPGIWYSKKEATWISSSHENSLYMFNSQAGIQSHRVSVMAFRLGKLGTPSENTPWPGKTTDAAVTQ